MKIDDRSPLLLVACWDWVCVCGGGVVMASQSKPCGARPSDHAGQPALHSGGKERPILFSGPMVRALLDGRKTQTRRIVKPQPTAYVPTEAPQARAGQPPKHPAPYFDAYNGGPHWCWWDTYDRQGPDWIKCPYGVPGDYLWVRETWGVGNRPCPMNGWIDGIEYRADCVSDDAPPLYDIIPAEVEADSIRTGWRPSIHMPRWASRLTLEITEVRVERLNDISPADADAEGFGGDFPDRVMPDVFPHRDGGWGHLSMPECYALLWEHINGAGSWATNPWVWAVSFEVIK